MCIYLYVCANEDDDPERRRWWVSRQVDRSMAYILWLFGMTFREGTSPFYSTETLKPIFRKYQFVTNDHDIL